MINTQMINKQGRFIFIIVLFTSFDLLAGSIQPDRPGFSTGTYTVKPGDYYIELGIQFDYANTIDDSDSFTTPLLNFRTGLNENTELNILVDGLNRDSDNNTTTSDMLIGVKHRLIVTPNYNISLLGFLSLPTGNSPNSKGGTYFLGLLWDYEINSSVSAFGTLQYISFVEENLRSNNAQIATGLSFSLTPKVSSYIEYYRDRSFNLNTKSIDVLGTGITYLFTKNIQLDTYLSISIDRDSNDSFGMGVAIKF